MELRINQRFVDKVMDQVEYIAQDKPLAALKFYNDLFERISKIPAHPVKHRKSIFAEDENVRDLIFKGYTVTYRILQSENVIEVFGFNKYQHK